MGTYSGLVEVPLSRWLLEAVSVCLGVLVTCGVVLGLGHVAAAMGKVGGVCEGCERGWIVVPVKKGKRSDQVNSSIEGGGRWGAGISCACKSANDTERQQEDRLACNHLHSSTARARPGRACHTPSRLASRATAHKTVPPLAKPDSWPQRTGHKIGSGWLRKRTEVAQTRAYIHTGRPQPLPTTYNHSTHGRPGSAITPSYAQWVMRQTPSELLCSLNPINPLRQVQHILLSRGCAWPITRRARQSGPCLSTASDPPNLPHQLVAADKGWCSTVVPHAEALLPLARGLRVYIRI
jgi:hypothetical protein